MSVPLIPVAVLGITIIIVLAIRHPQQSRTGTGASITTLCILALIVTPVVVGSTAPDAVFTFGGPVMMGLIVMIAATGFAMRKLGAPRKEP